MTDNEEYVTKKMNVKLKKEEYEKFINGETHSDNGLRRADGKLSSLPDIEIIPDEEEEYYSNMCNVNENDCINCSQSTDDNSNTEAMGYILAGLLMGIAIFSDEENRNAIKSWWTKKVVPSIKNKASVISYKATATSKSIKTFFSGETKAKNLLEKEKAKSLKVVDVKINHINTQEQTQNQQDFNNYINSEEQQKQIENIKMLTLVLAAKIKEFSDSYVRDDLTPEELIQQQNIIRTLTSKEVENSMRILVEDKSFMIDEPILKIFREFLLGNIIVGGKSISIEKYRTN